MKKYHFLNINPFYMIVLKFHMLLLTFIIKQFQNNVSLWVKVGIKVIFSSLNGIFGKNHVFLGNFIVNTF